jgi:competence protein ComEC
MRRFLPPPTFLLFAVALLAALIWWRAPAPALRMTVTVLDVGQGDSIVVQTPSGRVLVVDTGRATPEDDMGRRVTLPFLRAQGINRVDALALTHPDGDHIGGAATLMERIAVGRLLVSAPLAGSPDFRRVMEVAKRRGVPVATLARGQALDFRDGVMAEALSPPPERLIGGPHADNSESLVLRVRYGSTSLLLAGDAETETEVDMLRNCPDLRADALKLGHHGSKSSSSEPFLDAVRPRAAIVSAGMRNPFGHPNPDVLARLAARGVRVFRTDRSGAITLASDGRALRVTTALPSPAP